MMEKERAPERRHDVRELPLLYRVARPPVRGALWLRYRPLIQGGENVPARGGLILAANHLSGSDPVLIAVVSPRPVAFMAKKELFGPLLGPLLQRVNAFPVDRSHGDLGALKTAIRLLGQGLVLGIHYEGTRSRTGEALAPREGVGFLQAKTGVPVIPVAVVGTNQPWPARAHIRFGPPVPLDDLAPHDYAGRAERVAATVTAMRREMEASHR